LALIFLDSNKSSLKKSDWKIQTQWFSQTLLQLDADPSVRGIVVFDHHPPYSNHMAASAERVVQDAFAIAFIAARKTLAFVSGHVHGYERFVNCGKQFIISAGGGGPRASTVKSKKIRYQDKCEGPIPRPFNYLLIIYSQNGVRFVARGLNKGESNINSFDQVFTPFPAL
jgi:hypothetical protein